MTGDSVNLVFVFFHKRCWTLIWHKDTCINAIGQNRFSWYTCVLKLLYVSSCYHRCFLMLLYMFPHAAIYVSSYYYICVLILLFSIRSSCYYMFPHTTIYVCAESPLILVQELLWRGFVNFCTWLNFTSNLHVIHKHAYTYAPVYTHAQHFCVSRTQKLLVLKYFKNASYWY